MKHTGIFHNEHTSPFSFAASNPSPFSIRMKRWESAAGPHFPTQFRHLTFSCQGTISLLSVDECRRGQIKVTYQIQLPSVPECRRREPGMPVLWCTAAWFLSEMVRRFLAEAEGLAWPDGDDWSALTSAMNIYPLKRNQVMLSWPFSLRSWLLSVYVSGRKSVGDSV